MIKVNGNDAGSFGGLEPDVRQQMAPKDGLLKPQMIITTNQNGNCPAAEEQKQEDEHNDVDSLLNGALSNEGYNLSDIEED